MFKNFWAYRKGRNSQTKSFMIFVRFAQVHDTRSKIHNPAMHDSCINYANMLTLYRDKSWYKGIKNISVICKYMVSLRRGYTVKYFFQSISWNMYFTIVSLCKLPRNAHEIWKFWKLIFRIFSIVKYFPIEFVFMLD